MSNDDNTTKKITWLETADRKGEFLFTFDGVKIYNLFSDYPHNLSDEEKAIFDAENPYWVKFFLDRQK